MATSSNEVTVPNGSWVDLGAGPLQVQLLQSNPVYIEFADSMPASNAVGFRLTDTETPATFQTDKHLWARAVAAASLVEVAPYVAAAEAPLTALSNGDIGKVNVRHFNVAATGFTRPNNTTAYAAGDSVSDNATAGSVTALPVTVSDTNDDPVNLTQILLATTDTGFVNVGVRVHVFNSDPTLNGGVGAGDNSARAQKQAGWIGSFSGMMIGFSDGAKAVLAPDNVAVLIGNVAAGDKKLWWQLETLGAVTPAAGSTTFSARFKGYQGRV